MLEIMENSQRIWKVKYYMWKNLSLSDWKERLFSGKIWIKKDPSNEIAQQLDKNVIYFSDNGEKNKFSLNTCYAFGKDTQYV